MKNLRISNRDGQARRLRAKEVMMRPEVIGALSARTLDLVTGLKRLRKVQWGGGGTRQLPARAATPAYLLVIEHGTHGAAHEQAGSQPRLPLPDLLQRGSQPCQLRV